MLDIVLFHLYVNYSQDRCCFSQRLICMFPWIDRLGPTVVNMQTCYGNLGKQGTECIEIVAFFFFLEMRVTIEVDSWNSNCASFYPNCFNLGFFRRVKSKMKKDLLTCASYCFTCAFSSTAATFFLHSSPRKSPCSLHSGSVFYFCLSLGDLVFSTNCFVSTVSLTSYR